MGVYIKGMEMPKNCHSCPMCIMRFCQAMDRELSERETRPNAKRPEDCPLVPVPPHGRLLKVLKTERECVSRDCNRDCGKCDLSLEQDEVLSAYDFLITLFAGPEEEGK